MVALFGVIVGVLFLFGAFHPTLGPRLYRQDWPGLIADDRERHLATGQSAFLSVSFCCMSITAWLYSFHTDTWTVRGLIVLGVAALCAIGGLVVGLIRDMGDQ